MMIDNEDYFQKTNSNIYSIPDSNRMLCDHKVERTAQFFYDNNEVSNKRTLIDRTANEEPKRSSMQSQPVISKKFIQRLERKSKAGEQASNPDFEIQKGSVDGSPSLARKQATKPVKSQVITQPSYGDRFRGRSAQDPDSIEFSFNDLGGFPDIRESYQAGFVQKLKNANEELISNQIKEDRLSQMDLNIVKKIPGPYLSNFF